jgi:RNase adaptor protein for sRNA GlmZ degradation
VDLPELENAFRYIVEHWARRESPVTALPGLHVRVSSFSYRDGVPADDSEHGGGFVFDCRSLSNPGRLPELAGRIGTDPAIAGFLEALPETEMFWRHVTALVDAHIANFRERNFSDFSVAFGCTGGQHRSVYFAERLAGHVREGHPDVTTSVRHLGSPRWKLEPGAPGSVAIGAANPVPSRSERRSSPAPAGGSRP